MTRQPVRKDARLRALPSVDRLLTHDRCRPLLARFDRRHVAEACRRLLDEMRDAIRDEGDESAPPPGEEAILTGLIARLEADQGSRFRPVINATGTLIHTNLGRSALPDAAVEALRRVASQPVTLEYDLASGSRGRRESPVNALLEALTGAEKATVVNNNAAAVLLALNTLAEGREVIVSRGELVEIGGSFRIPDIMAKSGGLLREVGTTNRTHPDDYAEAITDRTALLLKVHTSNYRIVGFSSEVSLADLVSIGRTHGIPVMEDLGSGALVDLSRFGLPKEPLVAERLAAGADLVTFSGDKLLGGPQSGLVVGRAAVIDRIVRNPLHRALRCGKLTLAALEATLRLYQQSPALEQSLPTLRACTRPLEELEAGGRRILVRMKTAVETAVGPGVRVDLEPSMCEVGSGALPTEAIPTWVMAITHPSESASRLAARFREADPPIVGRIHDDRLLLDLRTVARAEDLLPRWP